MGRSRIDPEVKAVKFVDDDGEWVTCHPTYGRVIATNHGSLFVGLSEQGRQPSVHAIPDYDDPEGYESPSQELMQAVAEFFESDPVTGNAKYDEAKFSQSADVAAQMLADWLKKQ